MRKSVVVVVIGLVVSGCAAMTERSTEDVLPAPSKAAPAAAAANEEGNRLFHARKWEAAKAQYEAAIKAQPTLAEAHYNLGLVLDILGDDAGSRKHFIEAANLAPGHKVIWDAPPLRKHGDVEATPKAGSLLAPTVGGAH